MTWLELFLLYLAISLVASPLVGWALSGPTERDERGVPHISEDTQ